MSIWGYLADDELTTLKSLKQDIDENQYEIARIDTALEKEREHLRSVRKHHQDFKAQQVNVAIGSDLAYVQKPTDSVEEVEELVGALEARRKELVGQGERSNAVLNLKANRFLDNCVTRASTEYEELADSLAEQWRLLNSAQLALGDRELAWMHIFIPGLQRMPSSRESYSRQTIFTGRQEPSQEDGAIKAELEGLLG